MSKSLFDSSSRERIYIGVYLLRCLSCCAIELKCPFELLDNKRRDPQMTNTHGCCRSHHAGWSWARLLERSIKNRDGTGVIQQTDIGKKKKKKKRRCKRLFHNPPALPTHNCNWSVDSVSRTHYYILLKLTIEREWKWEEEEVTAAFKCVTLEEQEQIPNNINSGATRIGSKREKNKVVLQFYPLYFFFFSPGIRFVENSRPKSKGTRNWREKEKEKITQPR